MDILINSQEKYDEHSFIELESSHVIVYFTEIRDEFLSKVDHSQVQRTQSLDVELWTMLQWDNK